MTGLSVRTVSLSDHVKRRRSSTALSSAGTRGSPAGSRDGSSSGSSGSSSRRGRPQHPPSANPCAEGSYDAHAAAYGNCDAPSAHCRSYGASEVGCYATERYIGGGYRSPSPVAPRRGSFSDPEVDMDIEGQRREELLPRRGGRGGSGRGDVGPALRISPKASFRPTKLGEEESYAYYPRGADSCCPSTATASMTSSSSLDSSCSRSEDEALRQNIIDLSTLVATYIAGALSFVVGIFLALLSPFARMIQLILRDVTALLGEAGLFQELGSLWRMYRALRRRSAASASAEGRYNDDQSRSHCSEEYESHDGLSTHTENPQYVGGWRPRVAAPSVGSASTGGSSWSPYRPTVRARSQPSLPSVREHPGHERQRAASSPRKGPAPYHPDAYYGRPTQSPQHPRQMPRRGSTPYEPSYRPQASHGPSSRRSSCVV